jgi:hypothetical protein
MELVKSIKPAIENGRVESRVIPLIKENPYYGSFLDVNCV